MKRATMILLATLVVAASARAQDGSGTADGTAQTGAAPGASDDTAAHAGASDDTAAHAGASDDTAAHAGASDDTAAQPGASAEPPGSGSSDGQPGANDQAHANEAPQPGSGDTLPEGHPPVGQAQSPHSRLPDVLSAPELAQADASDDVPARTIRVRVVDGEGRPVANTAVDVGVLAQGDRTRHNGRTDQYGVAVFRDLPTGSGQAYRVNVPYRGATYSSAPFQLPDDRGYDVRITRLPVTQDDRFVFFHIFRVIVELKDERLHITHQAELTNAGRETYVFPASGLRARLPEGATAFQAQRIMTDQRVEEAPHGYALHGSLPPGTVQMAWAYDVPVDGEAMRVPVEMPLRFFGLQVFSEAPPGLLMSVPGMPDPQRMDNEGQPLWVTQVRRAPTDEPIERISIAISGIPGPGPLRWIAVVLALAFVLGGVFMLAQGGDAGAAASRARKKRREELLAEARELEADFKSGEVGPEFRQKRRAEIVRALAVLLHEEEAAGKQGASSRPAASTAGRPAARPAR